MSQREKNHTIFQIYEHEEEIYSLNSEDTYNKQEISDAP